jgi:hypothetical protein
MGEGEVVESAIKKPTSRLKFPTAEKGSGGVFGDESAAGRRVCHANLVSSPNRAAENF